MKRDKVRIPANESIKTRDGSTSKDTLIVNGFIDKKYTVKRPGLLVSASGSGAGNGIYQYGGQVFQWDSGATTPVTGWVVTGIGSGYLTLASVSGLTTGDNLDGQTITSISGNNVYGLTGYIGQVRHKVSSVFTLMRSIYTGAFPVGTPVSFYATATKLFYITDDTGSGPYSIYSLTNLDSGTPSYEGSSGYYGVLSPQSILYNTKFYNFANLSIGSFYEDVSVSPYNSWNEYTGLGAGADWYDTVNQSPFGGKVYHYAGSNVMYRTMLESPYTEEMLTTTGLPAAASSAMCYGTDGTNLFLMFYGPGTDNHIYKSTDGVNWSLFYTAPVAAVGWTAGISDGSKMYFTGSTTGGLPNYLYSWTIGTSTVTQQAISITMPPGYTENLPYVGPFYINSSIYLFVGRQNGTSWYLDIWKKTG